MGQTAWVSLIADNLNADTSNTYTTSLTLDPPPAGPTDSSIAFHYQVCYYHGLNWSWSGRTSYPRTIAVRGCSAPGGTLTAKLLLDGTIIATATQYVAVRDPAAPTPTAFQFTPSTLALGASSNVWEVPPGVPSVYLDVTFSSASSLDYADYAYRNIKVQLLADGASVLGTHTVANVNDRGVLASAGGGSRIRIDVDKDAFDTEAARVTLSFRSGSASGAEIATATVQTEPQPSAPLDGSATVDQQAGSMTLSWRPGPVVANSRPNHYKIVIPGGEHPYNSGRIDGLQHVLSDARALDLDGDRTAWVYHCTEVGGCSPSLSIRYTVLELPPAPTGLTATASGTDQVDLSWNLVSGARYRVEYRTSDTEQWTTDDEGISGTSSHPVTNLECGVSYYFRVSRYGDGSIHAAAWSEPSTIDSPTIIGCPPSTFEPMVSVHAKPGVGPAIIIGMCDYTHEGKP